MKRFSDDRLRQLESDASAELAELLQDRRDDPTPNAVRAQHIAELSAEHRLYCAELDRRGL